MKEGSVETLFACEYLRNEERGRTYMRDILIVWEESL